MMSDRDIRQALTQGWMRIDPIHESHIQPASVDLHLGSELRTLDGYLRPLPAKLEPGQFILGATAERIELGPYLAAQLAGKSSLGRIGLQVHCTAGFIDPGFCGQLTLEISNLSDRPLELTPGMPIGQICVFKLTSAALRPYGHPDLNSKYVGQEGPTLSRKEPSDNPHGTQTGP